MSSATVLSLFRNAIMPELLGQALLARARNAIATALDMPVVAEPAHPELVQPGATFVTLTQAGNLRGCIGSLVAHQRLDEDVRANARAAAFRDPRFSPLRPGEFEQTRVEVSLLTAPVDIAVRDEQDAIAQLRPGIDGIILSWHDRRGTFLPQVWASLPDPRTFLRQLKLKAGLPVEFWAPDLLLQRYEVRKWQEPTRR